MLCHKIYADTKNMFHTDTDKLQLNVINQLNVYVRFTNLILPYSVCRPFFTPIFFAFSGQIAPNKRLTL